MSVRDGRRLTIRRSSPVATVAGPGAVAVATVRLELYKALLDTFLMAHISHVWLSHDLLAGAFSIIKVSLDTYAGWTPAEAEAEAAADDGGRRAGGGGGDGSHQGKKSD